MTELSGTLEGVGLPAIVRFLTGLKKTGCLRISHQDWRGEVFFAAGQITSARLGSRRGLGAFGALVQSVATGDFAFDSDAPAADGHDIDLSTEALLAHLDDLEHSAN